VCVPLVVSAQHLAEHFRDKDLYPHVAYGVQDNPRVWTKAAGDEIAWQVHSRESFALPLQVEAETPIGRLVARVTDPTCVDIAGGYDCKAPLPASMRAAWDTITGIRLQPLDVVTGAPRLDLTSGEIAVAQEVVIPPRTCLYQAPSSTTVETRPVDTTIGGYLDNNLQTASARIGKLRRDGWRVEWQFVPGVPGTITSTPDRLVVMMWCFGTPQ